MLEFMSENSYELHREYLRQARLRYAILEDGIKDIKGKKYNEIIRQKINVRDKVDVLRELSDITLHNIFFNSFSEFEYSPCEAVRMQMKSEAELLNRVYSTAMAIPYGFIGVFVFDGKIFVYSDTDRVRLLSRGIPRLAVDVCEHAYFLDYGFDKPRYLLSALPYLDLNKLNS